MGHAKTSTTTNIYGHVIAASHAKALRTLDKFDDILLPLDKKPEVLGLE
jgi:hypothetical protein